MPPAGTPEAHPTPVSRALIRDQRLDTWSILRDRVLDVVGVLHVKEVRWKRIFVHGVERCLIEDSGRIQIHFVAPVETEQAQ